MMLAPIAQPAYTSSIRPLGANAPTGPGIAYFNHRLAEAAGHITAARAMLVGPQLMHQSIHEIEAASLAEARMGLMALGRIAQSQAVPLEALARVHAGQRELKSLLEDAFIAIPGARAAAAVPVYNRTLVHIGMARAIANNEPRPFQL